MTNMQLNKDTQESLHGRILRRLTAHDHSTCDTCANGWPNQ